jgi:hypothetical protein
MFFLSNQAASEFVSYLVQSLFDKFAIFRIIGKMLLKRFARIFGAMRTIFNTLRTHALSDPTILASCK